VSYRVSLTGLRVRGFHGVFEHERRDGQDFVVDVHLVVDSVGAADSGADSGAHIGGDGGAHGSFGGADRLAETVDYGVLAQQLHDVIAGEPVQLIETLADRLAAVCVQDVRVRRAEVTVHKPGAPIPLQFADVTVTVTRERAT
jgi:7,8-dihydroneopterin aldolase/epimerase/oxygenase